MNIDVIYEDQNILIVDKPQNLLVHSAARLHEPDLLTELRHPEYSIITRLDFQTSGLVLIAKASEVASILNRMTRENNIRKFYRTVLIGYLDRPEAVLTAYLVKDEKRSVVRISDIPIESSQKILTQYKVIHEEAGLSLVEIELLTGRTHQIRAHMAFLGHPVVGDPLYGNQSFNRKVKLKTQALSATKIQFNISEATNPLAYLNQRTFETVRFPYEFLMKKAMK